MPLKPHPLTREEKLLAEHSVQLGNIVEAIKTISTSGGMADTSIIEGQLSELRGRIDLIDAKHNTLVTQLQQLNTLLTAVQSAYVENTDTVAAPTPDTIQEIISHLNIVIPDDQQL